MTRRQLLDLGVLSDTITHWTRNGRLITVHAGVYAVGHRQHSPEAHAMAAVLACGPDAVLSHDSAAALWGVRKWPSQPEITAPHDRRRKGIRAHRSETLTGKQIRRHRNIRVTSPSRTILDIQGRLTDKQLTRAVNELRHQKHLKETELNRLLSKSRRVASLIDPAQNPTRSGLEDDFASFCREYGLPIPRTNVMMFGHEADAVFDAEKVIVEIDSWDYHKDHATFESDRRRDTVAARHGWLTVRITDTRFDEEPAAEADSLHETLASRRPRGSS